MIEKKSVAAMFQFRFHQEEQECPVQPEKQDFLVSQCIHPHPQVWLID